MNGSRALNRERRRSGAVLTGLAVALALTVVWTLWLFASTLSRLSIERALDTAGHAAAAVVGELAVSLAGEERSEARRILDRAAAIHPDLQFFLLDGTGTPLLPAAAAGGEVLEQIGRSAAMSVSVASGWLPGTPARNAPTLYVLRRFQALGQPHALLVVVEQGYWESGAGALLAGGAGSIPGLAVFGLMLLAAVFLVTRELRARYVQPMAAPLEPVTGFSRVARRDSASRADFSRTLSTSQTDLIANISHDLRTPLTSILGYTETILLKGDTVDPERRRELLQIVHSNTELLIRLVNEVFDLSRLDAGLTTPLMAPIDLERLSERIEHMFSPAAENKQIRLDVTNETTVFAEGDESLVFRALSNLVQNAIHYTPEGGRVEVVFAQSDGAIRFTVRDTGVGIPEAAIPYIFERFYRVDRDRARKTGGAGLGLAIAHRIVEAHGGAIAAESREGSGTSMSFTLPAVPRTG